MGNNNVIFKCATPDHKRAARMLFYAMTLGDFDGWAAAATVLRARLAATERAALAWAALRSLDADDADTVARHYLLGAGMPAPTFDDAKDEAAVWGAAAAARELRAYAAAAFKAMGRADRAAFLKWAGRAP